MLVTGFFCIILTPPFQVADEPNHFMRAMQIANGGLVGIRRSPLESGGMLPQSVPIVTASFDKLKSAPQEKVTPNMITQAMTVPWSSETVFVGFSTVLYPPSSYLGAASGILWGRFLHSSILGTFYLARVGNLLANVAISALALFLIPEISIFMLSILLLPMNISLMASCSQDGMMLALTSLGIGCFLRCLLTMPSWKQFLLASGAGIAFGCVAAAKTPYLMMVFTPVLLVNRQNIRLIITSCCSGLSVFSIWIFFGLRPVMTKLAPPGVSAAQQVVFGLHHPGQFLWAVCNTLKINWQGFITQIIGVLGWLDTPFTLMTYIISYTFLIITFSTSFLYFCRFKIREEYFLRLTGFLLITTISLFCIFAALYATWTPVGKDIVEGVQGRYFLPILMLGTLCPFIFKKYEEPDNSQLKAVQIVLTDVAINSLIFVFMLFCYIVLCKTLSQRYW
ncbi:DUF2142 domain-containing protein [Acetobacter orleanensis]|nr:DUF2142 domain-containing protein [Acetobacter orleanensis]PCD80442.1 DUF2142 domain-containing protein [Acetobacter orleanensis]